MATDLAGVEQCNSVLSDVKATVAGTSSPYFYLSAPAGTRWPEGLYRVEVSVNDTLAMVTDFGVCDGPCKFKTPLSWGLP